MIQAGNWGLCLEESKRGQDLLGGGVVQFNVFSGRPESDLSNNRAT